MLFLENEQGRKEEKSKKGQNVRSSTHGISRRNEVEYTPDDAKSCSHEAFLVIQQKVFSRLPLSLKGSNMSRSSFGTRSDSPGITRSGLRVRARLDTISANNTGKDIMLYV